jgi:hypothetical protein
VSCDRLDRGSDPVHEPTDRVNFDDYLIAIDQLLALRDADATGRPGRSGDEAASTLAAAVRARDHEALESGITNRGEAAQRLADAGGPDTPEPESEPR